MSPPIREVEATFDMIRPIATAFLLLIATPASLHTNFLLTGNFTGNVAILGL